jgi:hypothetical protein
MELPEIVFGSILSMFLTIGKWGISKVNGITYMFLKKTVSSIMSSMSILLVGMSY